MHAGKNLNIWLFTAIRKIFCFAILLTLAGCGPIYGIFIDPLVPKPKIPAEHDIAGKKVLVWVDDTACKTPNAIVRRELTQQIRQTLSEHHAVGSVIDYENIVQFRRKHPDLSELTIQQLGQTSHADEVLYVMIDNFSLHHEAGEGFYDTNMSGYCKIVNAADGKHLWPAEQMSRQFNAKGRFSNDDEPDMENKLIRELCREAAEEIALSFYKHQAGR
jgi:hypothetical protein